VCERVGSALAAQQQECLAPQGWYVGVLHQGTAALERGLAMRLHSARAARWLMATARASVGQREWGKDVAVRVAAQVCLCEPPATHSDACPCSPPRGRWWRHNPKQSYIAAAPSPCATLARGHCKGGGQGEKHSCWVQMFLWPLPIPPSSRAPRGAWPRPSSREPTGSSRAPSCASPSSASLPISSS